MSKYGPRESKHENTRGELGRSGSESSICSTRETIHVTQGIGQSPVNIVNKIKVRGKDGIVNKVSSAR